MTGLFTAIKAELERYEGCWMLPDDLDALAELCEAAVRRAQSGEWRRGGGSGPEYEVERPLEVEDLPFADDIVKAFKEFKDDEAQID